LEESINERRDVIGLKCEVEGGVRRRRWWRRGGRGIEEIRHWRMDEKNIGPGTQT